MQANHGNQQTEVRKAMVALLTQAALLPRTRRGSCASSMARPATSRTCGASWTVKPRAPRPSTTPLAPPTTPTPMAAPRPPTNTPPTPTPTTTPTADYPTPAAYYASNAYADYDAFDYDAFFAADFDRGAALTTSPLATPLPPSLPPLPPPSLSPFLSPPTWPPTGTTIPASPTLSRIAFDALLSSSKGLPA